MNTNRYKTHISAVMLFALVLLAVIDCRADDYTALISDGVNKELAEYRVKNYSNVCYDLYFDFSAYPDTLVRGVVTLSLVQKPDSKVLILDFKGRTSSVLSVRNSKGKDLNYTYKNEHIIIYERSEDNSYTIEFQPSAKSVNRREEFLYTLLVPDRARMLFPLFDQPDIKARYSLKLRIPEQWKAVSNGAVDCETIYNGARNAGTKTVTFKRSEPISSYLFAFCAGIFNVEERKRGENVYRIYHRESEEYKLAQFDEIFRELFHALDWLEDYTGIAYPFSKYDMVLIPGFQYGGMEHAGATFYNASTMFLGLTPTISQRLARAKLIAHETSHMWFGDYVTMKWFDEVWLKEVFANYFATKIAAPLFPEIESDKSMVSYFSSAMGEDRTDGAQPVLQELDNLKYAGLIYNNIIYNKSPIIFSMITQRMGDEAFRKSLQVYLKRYGYGCATWSDLTQIFDTFSKQINITEWSKKWMENSGMQHYRTAVNGSVLSLYASYPKAHGVTLQQNISFDIIGRDGTGRRISADVKDNRTDFEMPANPIAVLPNCDAMSYGYFELDAGTVDYIFDNFTRITSQVAKRSLLITMYENMLNGNISAEKFVTRFVPSLVEEQDDLIYNALLSYSVSAAEIFVKDSSVMRTLDSALWKIYGNAKKSEAIRYNTIMAISELMCTRQSKERIFEIWRDGQGDKSRKIGTSDVRLSESDYIRLSKTLALAFPEKAESIVSEQTARIKSADKKEEYKFVSKALDSNAEKRWEFFSSLKDVKNRTVENWVVQSLSLLTYRTYSEQQKSRYIRPALELLPEIQRTGDIFFPQKWCAAILAGCRGGLSLREVQRYITSTPYLHPLLKSKVQIASYHLNL